MRSSAELLSQNEVLDLSFPKKEKEKSTLGLYTSERERYVRDRDVLAVVVDNDDCVLCFCWFWFCEIS